MGHYLDLSMNTTSSYWRIRTSFASYIFYITRQYMAKKTFCPFYQSFDLFANFSLIDMSDKEFNHFMCSTKQARKEYLSSLYAKACYVAHKTSINQMSVITNEERHLGDSELNFLRDDVIAQVIQSGIDKNILDDQVRPIDEECYQHMNCMLLEHWDWVIEYLEENRDSFLASIVWFELFTSQTNASHHVPFLYTVILSRILTYSLQDLDQQNITFKEKLSQFMEIFHRKSHLGFSSFTKDHLIYFINLLKKQKKYYFSSNEPLLFYANCSLKNGYNFALNAKLEEFQNILEFAQEEHVLTEQFEPTDLDYYSKLTDHTERVWSELIKRLEDLINRY